jgi:type I restriction enzyme S subunit
VKLPRYSKYKDSGVEWLGEVPHHWDILPLFASCYERIEDNEGMREDNLLSLSYGRIIRKDISANDGLLPESFETYQIVHPGDIIFRLTDLQNDKRSLRSAIVQETGIITFAYVAVVPHNANPDFMHHLFRAYDVSKVFYSMGGGLRQAMKFADLKRMPVLVPPLPEQHAIATFLDRETAKIDALIAEQERLIELLTEKRQAVISHAVTKGLNPDAPMKDSGIEWLGEVPEHWEVGALGYFLDAVGDVDHYMPPSVEEGVPYVMTGDLEEFASDINFSRCKQVTHHDYLRLAKKIRTTKGDLIMARYATIGTVSYVDLDFEFLVSYSCVTIKPCARKTLGRYLFFCLKSDSFIQGIQERINTNTQGNVGIADLRKVKVVLPPIDEQLRIAEHLQAMGVKLGMALEKSVDAIALLQERRTALISAAVTGKIDVRGLVPEISTQHEETIRAQA